MALLKKTKDPFKEIQSCLQKRDYKGALVWFNPLLKKDTQNPQIRLRYADTLVLAGSKKEAIRQYRVVADELAEAGFMIRAIAINKKIVQLDPSQSDVHEKLAEMNEQRSRTTSSAGALPVEAPPLEELPRSSTEKDRTPDEDVPGVEATGPTLTLEESIAMEFGETARAAPDDQTPAAPSPEAAADEIEEIEVEEDISNDVPSFAEAPIALGEGAELEVVVEDELEPELEPKPEPEPEDLLEEEDLEVEIEIETEPEMAADGNNPLVGLLGDDIDSLVDSIIDDVANSGAGSQAPSPPATKRIPLFSDLTAEEFVDVAIMLVRRAEKVGTVIVKEGDPGDSMFIVSTGEVDATREDAGKQVKLATLRDGDFFGEMAVLSGDPRTATVTTVRNTELLELSRNDLETICTRHPEVEAKLRLASDERRMKSSP